jgi:kumamolisin
MKSEIRGSERHPPEGARAVGPAPRNEYIEVSIYLRPRPTEHPTAPPLPQGRRRLTREEFASVHGADPDVISKVEAFARDHGLTLMSSDAARRVVILGGTASSMETAFDVKLQHFERDGQIFRGRVGNVRVPADLAELIEAVVGLDERPQARPFVRIFKPSGEAVSLVATSFTAPEVAALYDFPAAGNGAGQTVGIIELGGGFVQSDLAFYFAQLGLSAPQILTLSVDGGVNSPGGDADAEVALDIEVIGAVAPGATIVVYFAPNSDRGFLDAVTTAIHDSAHRPSVLSISWGNAESTWTTQAMRAMDQAFQDAATLGVTVCCASGDSGSGDGVDDGHAHADFPASSPFALGCGGTRLEAANGAVTSEVVWNDDLGATGGGVSDNFDLPSWQVGVGVPTSVNPGGRTGRGAPDVAGNAAPQTGYQIRLGGQTIVVGGTSAVAPLWAGLFALVNEQLNEPVGYVTPLLYQELRGEAAVVRDVVSGNNGSYQAAPGWDACTGLGSPGGTDWLAALIY